MGQDGETHRLGVPRTATRHREKHPQLRTAAESGRASTAAAARSPSATPHGTGTELEVRRPTTPMGQSSSSFSKVQPPLCLDKFHPKWALAVTKKTGLSLSAHILPLPKSNTSAEEHRFSRGRKFLHFLFSFRPSVLHPELKLGHSQKRLQRTCKTFPTGEPGIWSCPLSKWTKDAGSAWRGSLAGDGLSRGASGYETLVMLSELPLSAGSLLSTAACVRAAERLKGTANRGARFAAPAAFRALSKDPRGGFAFSVRNSMLQTALLQR